MFFFGPFGCEERGGSGEHDRHGAHHEGGVADRGAGQAMKLEQKLEGNAEKGAEEQQTRLGGGEPETAAMDEGHGQHAQGGKEKAVEHHVLDAHLVERETAEVKAGAPEAAGDETCAVTEKGEARRAVVAFFVIHFYCRTWAELAVSLPNLAALPAWPPGFKVKCAAAKSVAALLSVA
jgi:hypothetical protein